MCCRHTCLIEWLNLSTCFGTGCNSRVGECSQWSSSKKSLLEIVNWSCGFNRFLLTYNVHLRIRDSWRSLLGEVISLQGRPVDQFQAEDSELHSCCELFLTGTYMVTKIISMLTFKTQYRDMWVEVWVGCRYCTLVGKRCDKHSRMGMLKCE